MDRFSLVKYSNKLLSLSKSDNHYSPWRHSWKRPTSLSLHAEKPTDESDKAHCDLKRRSRRESVLPVGCGGVRIDPRMRTDS
ncbi:hypothetical protein RRG08_018008 [Elysia crispata]|uniref:Uncharacterized protein n=1 Tax=Elysia crispata TaxID=231223 RepID=A0AAE0ZDX7_9GAST|nr:hypothetical protein RRG08_018008 [Elysia crispata]